MFSQTAEYALRAVVWLAAHAEEGPVGNQRIAEETQVPPTYLAKVLQELAKTDIIRSRRGVGGGFALNRAATELSVLDVINAVDPIEPISACPLHLNTHAKRLCPMHARLAEATETMLKVLRNSTISEMLSEPDRPKPLVES